MGDPSPVIASLDGTRRNGPLDWLRSQAGLWPLVREALPARLVRDQAEQAGLPPTAAAPGPPRTSSAATAWSPRPRPAPGWQPRDCPRTTSRRVWNKKLLT